MDTLAWGQLALFLIVLFVAAWPLARWVTRVVQGQLPRPLLAVERGVFRLTGVHAEEGMHWKRYALALLLFNFIGVLVVYALQR